MLLTSCLLSLCHRTFCPLTNAVFGLKGCYILYEMIMQSTLQYKYFFCISVKSFIQIDTPNILSSFTVSCHVCAALSTLKRKHLSNTRSVSVKINGQLLQRGTFTMRWFFAKSDNFLRQVSDLNTK